MNNKKTLIILFIAHIICLLLAATKFTIISWIWGNNSWQLSYFQYCYRNGWGHAYVSDFELSHVLSYIIAYTLGAAAFGFAASRYRLPFSRLGTIVCITGAASFSIEATHWLWNHHLSLIGSFPIIMVVVWVCVGAQIGKLDHNNIEDNNHN